MDYRAQGSKRTYYDDVGEAIQVSKHKYVEPSLIRRWKSQMNASHVSAENCAAIYLDEFPNVDESLPAGWDFKASTLDGEEVFDGVVVISLLEDCRLRRARLRVPHGGLQCDRYTKAMEARNLRYRLYGMPDIDHTCSKCVRIVKNEDGGVYVRCFLRRIY